MSSLDKRPVFKNKNIEKAFKNAEYYFVKYIRDCPICLEFFISPQVLPCGHCYCLDCISRCTEYSKHCPMCNEFFWIHKPVLFFFVQEIGTDVLLRKCSSEEVINNLAAKFYDNPFSLEYFEESEIHSSSKSEIQSNSKLEPREFYQISDGQLYFLDPEITKKMDSRPLNLYCRVKDRRECVMDKAKYPELGHIPTGIRIVILKIYN